GERSAIERDRLAEDVLVAAELLLPKRVRQHRDIGTAGFVFLGGKDAAKKRLQPEGAEKVFGNANAVDVLRLAPARHREPGKGLRGKFGEALLLIAPGLKARPGNVR